MTTTGVPGDWRCNSRRTSIPVPSGSLMSSRTAGGRQRPKERQPLADVGGLHRAVAARVQHLHAHLADELLVIDDENGVEEDPPWHSRRRGRVIIPGKSGQPRAHSLRHKDRMNSRNCRGLLAAAAAVLAAGCYDFHLTGPEDAPSVSPPHLVSVTIEYRQPLGCVNSTTNCDDKVVFFASWMRQGDEFALVRDPGGLIWRGVATGVPVNFPPRDSPHAVRVYDPHIRDHPNGGLTPSG
jgi:hypothetical protein